MNQIKPWHPSHYWRPPGQLAGPYNTEPDTAGGVVVSITTLAGNVGGGWYAYKAKKGSFWWTILGILVGGTAGNLVGRLVTLPMRK